VAQPASNVAADRATIRSVFFVNFMVFLVVW
jgi:hypothetical protein